MKSITSSLLLVAGLFLASCTTGSAVVVGAPRPAMSALAVQLFLEPPKTPYETIALVKAVSPTGFTSQGGQDNAVAELKAQAAAVGANGLILTGTSGTATGGLFPGGTQSVSGTAIFLTGSQR